MSRDRAGSPFAHFFEEMGLVVLDGGLATALEERGHRLDSKLWSAKLLLDDPGAIRAVHGAYLRAGADCITTASYQASFRGFAEAGLSEADAVALLRRSSELALQERDAFGPRPLVAASVGPFGAYLADGSEYDGRYGVPAARLDLFHRRRFGLLASSGVDLIACETLPSGREAGVLLDILDDAPDGTWAWLSFSCRDGARLHDGTPIEEVVESASGRRGVAAVGVNCTAPAHVPELISRARAVTDLPLVAYPNSGERYDPRTGSWASPPSVGPARSSAGSARPHEPWLSSVLAAIDAGASVVGGCCRVGPDAIAELRRSLGRGD